MLSRREKIIVAAIPLGIVIILVWTLWLSPRLIILGMADGNWSDYASVRHERIGDETVVSFRPRTGDALKRMIERLELTPGRPFGNTDEIADSALRSYGRNPNEFQRYFSVGREHGLLFLYTRGEESVIVRINL